MPLLAKKKRPKFNLKGPRELALMREAGRVVRRVLDHCHAICKPGITTAEIDEQGNVTEVSVLKGLPMGLSEAAMNAVRQWKFKPAMLNGKPVAVYFNLTVNFQLQ